MRIIRRVAILAFLMFMPVTPHIAYAAQDQSSNETQTNPKIEGNLIIDDGIIKDKQTLILENGSYNSEGYAPVKNEYDERMEKLLARYGERIKKADLPEGPFIINASAYTAAADECGKSDGITASGLMVKEKETIACPPNFPLGTKLSIEGMGTYVCEDRGGAIKGNHVDIYVETKKEAFNFGRRNLLAEVVK